MSVVGLRPSLLVGGHDPGSAAGLLAFLGLAPAEQASYLHSLEYLEADYARLLSSLTAEQQAVVLELLAREHAGY